MFESLIPTLLAAISTAFQKVIPSSEELPPDLTILAEALSKHPKTNLRTSTSQKGSGPNNASLEVLSTFKALRNVVASFLLSPEGEALLYELQSLIDKETGYASIKPCTVTDKRGKKCPQKTRVFCCSTDADFMCPMCNPHCQCSGSLWLLPRKYYLCQECKAWTMCMSPTKVNAQQNPTKAKCFVCSNVPHIQFLGHILKKPTLPPYFEFLYSKEEFRCHINKLLEGKPFPVNWVSFQKETHETPTYDICALRDYLIECLTHEFYEHLFSVENIKMVFPTE